MFTLANFGERARLLTGTLKAAESTVYGFVFPNFDFIGHSISLPPLDTRKVDCPRILTRNFLIVNAGKKIKSAVEFQKAVGSGGAFIDDADLFGLGVAEDKEVVVEQIHLHDGFLHVHGFDDEVFCFDDGGFVFVFRDAQTEQICVVYKRNAGAYGLLEFDG